MSQLPKSSADPERFLLTRLCVPQLQALQSQLDFQEQSMVEKSLVSRQEAKTRELESKLEFERTQVKRLEVGGSERRGGGSDPGRPGPWQRSGRGQRSGCPAGRSPLLL